MIELPGESPIWIIDTSSLILIRALLRREEQDAARDGLSKLVTAGRLVYPKEVVKELQRYQGAEQPALQWAQGNEARATARQPSMSQVKEVLAEVEEVLDPDKDSGVDEADPYVLAMALFIKSENHDVRIVTEEFKTTGTKMCLAGAAGYLGLPSVSLRVMLKFEDILPFDTE